MSTIEELEQHLIELEARLPSVRAAVPPITIGELTDVPTPGAAIASLWTQEVTNRALHRFANFTTLTGWAAANGSIAITTDNSRIYLRYGGAWRWIAGGSPPGFIGAPTGTQTVNSGVATTAQWGGTEVDPDNMFDNTGGIFNCPAAFVGRWRFDYSIRWGVNATGYRNAWLQHGPSTQRYGQVGAPAAGADPTIFSGSAEFIVNANDTVSVATYQTSGVTLQLNATTQERFVGRYLGPS